MPRLTPQQHLQTIRLSVAAIERALTRLKTSLNGQPTRKRKLNLSPKRKAALKLHGSYLGHMRQLKPAQKVKVKALKVAKGYHAAIALARRLRGG